MVKASIVFLLISCADSMRVGQEIGTVTTLDMDEEGGQLESPFTCPSQCVECCSKLRSLTGLVSSYYVARNRFKCITRVHDSVPEIPGYECSEPEVRQSHDGQMKRTCYFTAEERQAGAHRSLQRCTDSHTMTFAEFMGPDACSTTAVGAAISRATGRHFGLYSAVDLVILEDSHSISGGASSWVARQYGNADMLPPGMTRRDLELQLSDRLRFDLESKRMNRYAMGVWAGGSGPLVNFSMQRASFPPRPLSKAQVSGWPARLISTETLEDDMRQIELFQCPFVRLSNLPMEDNMDDNWNQWGEGAPDPVEVNEFYFMRFGTYQTPFHFIVPQNEINSNRILEQMVFQNVGSHHLELINSLDGSDAGFISPLGLGACPSTGLPVVGCPFPLSSTLSALPEPVRRTTKFVVRMEGTFDDVPRRPGLAKWGSNAFFDGEGHVIALQYEGRTVLAEEGGRDWEYFKFVFRSSLFAWVTAFDHLVLAHMLAAETLAIATAENLGPDNELRMLINPHMTGSMDINVMASSNLFPRGGLVHRSSPFADAGFGNADGTGTGQIWGKTVVLRYTRFGDVYRTYRQHFEELRSEGVQMPELPFFEDGLLIYQELQRYVEDAITLIYGSFGCNARLLADHEAQRFLSHFWALTDPATPDLWPAEFRRPTCNALKELLTEVIFTVSGWHRHVGTVADFVRDTRLASTVWKEGEMNTRPAQAVQMMVLAQGTNAILPKFTHDLADLIYGEHETLAENFRTFSRRMLEIQEEIEQRNQVRLGRNEMPYHQMEPNLLEYGVEV